MTVIDEDNRSARMWTYAIVACIVIAIVRTVLFAFASNVELIGDEAFYWEWAQRPALSYYTKGPGVAWLIGVSTAAFGDSEFGVRAFAPLCGAIVAICAGSLARPIAPRAAAITALLISCAPIFQWSSALLTIDGPYGACWAAACVAMRSAWFSNRWSAWIFAGLAVGIGFLFKYTILLLPLSWMLFVLCAPRRCSQPRSWRTFAAAITFGLCTLPVVIWNIREGWPTIAHLLGHLGVRGGDMPVTQGAHGWKYNPMWTLSFIGSQIGLIGPALVLGITGAARAIRNTAVDPQSETRRYLAWCSLPLFAFYLLISFIAEPEGNWPMGAGITTLALAGIAIHEGLADWKDRMARWQALDEPRPRRGWWLRRPQSFSKLILLVTVWIGAISLAIQPFADKIALMAPDVLPVSRISGARVMANESARLLATLQHADGQPAFLVSKSYGVAAQMRFYMEGSPITYCSGKTLNHGRVTQYDFWEDTDLRDPSLEGRNALAIGGEREDWTPFFETVGEAFTLNGDKKERRFSYLCYGYKGVPNVGVK